jgi:hypothetical protein
LKGDLRKAVDLLETGDWQAAHAIVQEDEDSRLFCWAHGIVHLMEGDLSNARYWYRKAGRPPFTEAPLIPGEIRALKAELDPVNK